MKLTLNRADKNNATLDLEAETAFDEATLDHMVEGYGRQWEASVSNTVQASGFNHVQITCTWNTSPAKQSPFVDSMLRG